MIEAKQTTWRRLCYGGLAAFLVAISGCGEPNVSEEDAERYVDRWSPSVETTLREKAVAPAGKEEFHQRLDRAVKDDEAALQRDEPPYDLFVDRAYREFDYEFQFVDRGGLTERGEVVWKALQDVEEHALDADDYALEEIEADLGRLAEAEERFEELGSFEVSEDERRAAREWLTEQPESEFELNEDNFEVLTDQVLDSDSGERMKERLDDYEELSGEMAEYQARLEHLLAANLLQYAREMKHFRLRDIFIHERHDDRWTDPEIEGRRPDRAKGSYRAGQMWRRAAEIADEMSDETEVLHARLVETLKEALGGDTEAALADLEPDQPQYEGLKSEYVRYKEIVDEGGWEKVPVTNGLAPGSSHATVEKLKERLQIEGYYPEDAEIDRQYDQALEDAIRTYQETHQMRVTGRPHHSFWSSLNIPANRRMQQIALNMQRWRESNVRHSDPRYVFINIPDFHAEVWNEQERDMRFRIVVGNNDRVEDDDDEPQAGEPALDSDHVEDKKHPNRTPTLSAYIDRVIYNPFWNVTDRIREEDITPEVREWVENQYQANIVELVEKRDAEVTATADSPEEDEPTFIDNFFGSPAAQDEREPASEEEEADAEESDADDEEDELSEAEKAAQSYWSENADGELVFDIGKLVELIDADDDADESVEEALDEQFPYLDAETGTVDVSSTDPDRIPAWYEENDYEVMFPGTNWEYVRMKQGDENALGKVKIIFPNLHDVYLHDTPHKALFNREIRAFSHGCMRVNKPLDFAEYLLEQDGQLDDYNIDHILAETIYEPIFLEKQIPVHIDYMTVRVDDEGRANFLADIYDYDEFGEEG